MFGISNTKWKFICAFSFLAGAQTSQAEELVLRFIHSSHFHPTSRMMFSEERSLVLFSCYFHSTLFSTCQHLEIKLFCWKSGHSISSECSRFSIRDWRTLYSGQMLATSLKVLWLTEVKPFCVTGSAHTSFHYFLHLHQLELWRAWGYSWLLKTWSTPRWCLNRAPERPRHISLANKTLIPFISDRKIHIRCNAKASHQHISLKVLKLWRTRAWCISQQSIQR